jgi:hypothetical protein
MKIGYLTKEIEKDYSNNNIYKNNRYKSGTYVEIHKIRLDELNQYPDNKEGKQVDWVVRTRNGNFIDAWTNEELHKYVKINK